jgi:Asp/Glu/hydantoin racemase
MPYFGLREANNHEISKAMLKAPNEAFDAIAGACFSDGAIRIASNLMDIPVVGPGQSSMVLATMMGVRFAIVTSDATPETEHYIDLCGLTDHVIDYQPVRCLTVGFSAFLDCLDGDYTPAVENFREVARGCIKDGADVLIAGCGLLSPMLSLSNVKDIDGVPVIDPMQVALKFAEMMVDFKRAGSAVVSHQGLYLRAGKDDIQNACKLLGLL